MSSRKRILLVSTEEIPVPPEHYGGIERVVANVGAGLVRRGHEVTLLAAAGSRLEGAQCRSWTRSAFLPGGADLGLQVLREARRFRADLVHSFGQAKWMLPWCIAGGRAVMSFGALPQPRVRHMVRLFREQLLLAGCSDYICAAGAARVAGRWRTAYNCLDMNRIGYQEAVAPDAPLVFLSRIDANKGAHVAIEVARKAGRRLVIAGNHSESGESGRYWREAILPRLDPPAVEFVGPVNDAQKYQLLSGAAALLVPIQWDEPFGVVFIEALACGTPVISCARGALPEIVRSGTEGFLCDGVEDLVRAVSRLGEIDRGACRRRAEDGFSAERIVERYEALYDELLGAECPGC